MRIVNYLIVGALLVCISVPATAQKITQVYTGTLKCQGLEKADSIKKDFLAMLDKICCVKFNNSTKVYYLPEDKEVKISSDSITFNASEKLRYTLHCNTNQNFVVEKYVYLLKDYQMKFPDATIYWKTKDLEYAKRFADDLVYLQNIRQLEEKVDFDSIAAGYRRLGVKPAITEEARRYIVQANAMTQAKNYKKAIEYYNEAIKVNPATPMVYNNQALLYAMVGQYREAIGCMKKYLKLVPDAEDSRAVQDKIYEYEAMITK